MLLRGQAFIYGDDVDTDVIFPGIYLGIFDPEDMARHAMEGLDPDFLEKIRNGGIVVAGKNFGTGSAREQAAACLKYSGVTCVVAKSFARSFYRNAINRGLPLITLPQGTAMFREGDDLEVDVKAASVRLPLTGEAWTGIPLAPLVMDILAAGGAVPYFKERCQ